MKAFERWLKRFYKNHQGDKRFNPQAKVGWREALEWVKKEAISLDERGDISRDIINRELES